MFQALCSDSLRMKQVIYGWRAKTLARQDTRLDSNYEGFLPT